MSLLIALAVPTGALARARVSPQDRAATRAYLEAQYTYDQSALAGAPASAAAVQALASRLESECPRVLLGAPHETPQTLPESIMRHRSPRRKGEEQRENRQWSDLQAELVVSLGQAEIEPNRQAALAYARTVQSLRWSEEDVTVFERARAAEGEAALTATPPEVCADMRAWVASGYRSLSTATKTLTGERDSSTRSAVRLAQELGSSPGSDPLASYEGPREKVLLAKIRVLERERESALKSVVAIATGLRVTLGLVSQAETEVGEEPPKGSVEIGHGSTAGGGSYTVWLEPKKPGAGSHGCPLNLWVAETETSRTSSGVVKTGSGGSSACLSRSHPESPSVQCRTEGLITIEAQTLSGTRTVRLHLGDGRQITSRVAIVPTRLGGPAGFYYQVVRGPSPIPVSLTEVGLNGRVLRTVKLPRAVGCTRQPRMLIFRTIATVNMPKGPSFSIVGERFSFMGETHFQLHIVLSPGEEPGAIVGEPGGITVGGAVDNSGPFAPQLKTGCQPHEYAILYGVLNAPGDTVLARSSGSLQPFRRVRIPASLHSRGVLVYLARPVLPNEVIVRTPKGKTVLTYKLGGQALEARETCEGEAEGPA